MSEEELEAKVALAIRQQDLPKIKIIKTVEVAQIYIDMARAAIKAVRDADREGLDV